MSAQAIEQLALDTLYARRMHRDGSCFVHNAAGVELRAETSGALPVIEQILEHTVDPLLRNSRENERVSAIRSRLRDEMHIADADRMPIRSPDFPGLDYLLGAYLVIAAKSDPGRAVDLLSRSSAALKREALSAIPIFFRLMSDGYNSGIAPPELYRGFARQLAESEFPELRLAAKRALLYVTWVE